MSSAAAAANKLLTEKNLSIFLQEQHQDIGALGRQISTSSGIVVPAWKPSPLLTGKWADEGCDFETLSEAVKKPAKLADDVPVAPARRCHFSDDVTETATTSNGFLDDDDHGMASAADSDGSEGPTPNKSASHRRSSVAGLSPAASTHSLPTQEVPSEVDTVTVASARSSLISATSAKAGGLPMPSSGAAVPMAFLPQRGAEPTPRPRVMSQVTNHHPPQGGSLYCYQHDPYNTSSFFAEGAMFSYPVGHYPADVQGAMYHAASDAASWCTGEENCGCDNCAAAAMVQVREQERLARQQQTAPTSTQLGSHRAGRAGYGFFAPQRAAYWSASQEYYPSAGFGSSFEGDHNHGALPPALLMTLTPQGSADPSFQAVPSDAARGTAPSALRFVPPQLPPLVSLTVIAESIEVPHGSTSQGEAAAMYGLIAWRWLRRVKSSEALFLDAESLSRYPCPLPVVGGLIAATEDDVTPVEGADFFECYHGFDTSSDEALSLLREWANSARTWWLHHFEHAQKKEQQPHHPRPRSYGAPRPTSTRASPAHYADSSRPFLTHANRDTVAAAPSRRVASRTQHSAAGAPSRAYVGRLDNALGLPCASRQF